MVPSYYLDLYNCSYCSLRMALHSCHAHQLDCKPNLIAYRECLDLGLTVNTDKSKVVVLKKVGSWEEVRDGLSVVTFSR